MKTHTPKHVALQLASLITLYVSLTAFLVVAFGVIDLTFKDVIDSWEYTSTQGSVRFSIALLVVFFPAYLFLTRKTNQVKRSEDSTYATLTKWLVYLSLVVGGLVFLGNLVAVLYAFLEGEITTRFILKSGSLALMIGFAGFYYIKDAQEYWQTHERQSLFAGAVASILVAVVLVFGFVSLDTPAEVREQRIDDIQVNDLQNIQYSIEEYYRLNEVLPSDLKAVGEYQPPEGRAAYTYHVVDATSYELCATFTTDNTAQRGMSTRPVPVFDMYSWEHGVGEECFTRRIERLKM